MTCSFVLLAYIAAALMVMTGGQLMECLANGGMLSMNDAVKENDWTMGVVGFVSTVSFGLRKNKSLAISFSD